MLVSGGVDSTVCAALVAKAIGPERVIALHIDNGFMRQNEVRACIPFLSVELTYHNDHVDCDLLRCCGY